MKFTAVVISLLLSVPPTGGQEPVKYIRIEWDYPASEITDDMWWKIYSHTNPAVPVSQWPVIAEIPATATNTFFVIAVEPGARFFQVTANNAFGESDFASTQR